MKPSIPVLSFSHNFLLFTDLDMTFIYFWYFFVLLLNKLKTTHELVYQYLIDTSIFSSIHRFEIANHCAVKNA